MAWRNGPSVAGAVENMLPIVPTAWEMLLADLGVAEEHVMRELDRRSIAGKRLRDFVHECFRHRYIPEPVLKELGLATAVEKDAGQEAAKYRRREAKGESK